MDPQACLDRMRDAAHAHDWTEVYDAAQDYAEWRAKGGFHPPAADCQLIALVIYLLAQIPRHKPKPGR